jgi:hypothetical protein
VSGKLRGLLQNLDLSLIERTNEPRQTPEQSISKSL